MAGALVGYGVKKAAKKVAAKLKPKPTAAQAAKTAARAKTLKRLEGHETSPAFKPSPQTKGPSPREIRESVDRGIKDIRQGVKDTTAGSSKVKQASRAAAAGGVAAAGGMASKKERGRGAKK